MSREISSLRQKFKALSRVTIDLVAQTRRAKAAVNDILGTIMQARDRDHLQATPDVQLAREVMALVVAAHETTASVLNWRWYLLSRHPQCGRACGRWKINSCRRVGKSPCPHTLFKGIPA
jgi:cytochrome P450